MTGILTGYERSTPGEDVYYEGTLARVTAIDYCETKGRKRAGDDERVWCAARLIGSAVSGPENLGMRRSPKGEAGPAAPDPQLTEYNDIRILV